MDYPENGVSYGISRNYHMHAIEVHSFLAAVTGTVTFSRTIIEDDDYKKKQYLITRHDDYTQHSLQSISYLRKLPGRIGLHQ